MESCFFLTRRRCKKLSSSNALLSTYLEFFLLSNLRQRLWNSSSLTSLENFLKTSCTKKVALNCFLSLMSIVGCQKNVVGCASESLNYLFSVIEKYSKRTDGKLLLLSFCVNTTHIVAREIS